MTRAEIIDLVQGQGGFVSLKQLGEGQPLAVFSALIGCDARCGTQGWEYSILLTPESSGWKIGFGQASETRPLASGELKEALVSWLRAPGMEPFTPYRCERAAGGRT